MAEARRPPAPAFGEDPIVHLCAFRVGGEDYAIDVMRVREIIPSVEVTPVPRAPPFIPGVIRLRGEVIPIVDARVRLGLPAAAPTGKTKFLVVKVGPRRIGLVVDEVTEVVRVPRSEIRPAPALPESGATRWFLGVCGGDRAAPGRRGPARLRLLLNVGALVEPARAGEAEAARAQAEASRRA